MLHETCKTVLVKTKNGPVRINESDFDKKKHELASEKPSKDDGFDRDSAKTYLKSKDIKFAGNISNSKLKQLVEDTEKAVEGEETDMVLEVKEVNGEFVIVDSDDNKVGADSFETEEEANAMLKIFTGE